MTWHSFTINQSDFDKIAETMTLSSKEYQINESPFFVPQKATKFDLTNTFDHSKEHKDFISTLPEHLQFLYNKVDPDQEINVGRFVLIKLSNVYERRNTWSCFVDFGISYIGMGHVVVLSMEKESKKFFFRRDGGSNGYDRQDNYDKYSKFVIDKNNENLMTFDYVINYIIGDCFDLVQKCL